MSKKTSSQATSKLSKALHVALKATSLEASNPYYANATIRQLRNQGRVGVITFPAQHYESLPPAMIAEMFAQVATLSSEFVVETPEDEPAQAYYVFKAVSPKFRKTSCKGNEVFTASVEELPHYFVETWRLESGLFLKALFTPMEAFFDDESGEVHDDDDT